MVAWVASIAGSEPSCARVFDRVEEDYILAQGTPRWTANPAIDTGRRYGDHERIDVFDCACDHRLPPNVIFERCG
jgi:hypothetical protein